MHPFGARRLIFQPSEEQLDKLCAFLQAPAAPAEDGPPSPLPLAPEKWSRRVNPWDALESLHIFRDRYERRRGDRPRQHLVALEDDPHAQDLLRWIKERQV